MGDDEELKTPALYVDGKKLAYNSVEPLRIDKRSEGVRGHDAPTEACFSADFTIPTWQVREIADHIVRLDAQKSQRH